MPKGNGDLSVDDEVDTTKVAGARAVNAERQWRRRSFVLCAVTFAAGRAGGECRKARETSMMRFTASSLSRRRACGECRKAMETDAFACAPPPPRGARVR